MAINLANKVDIMKKFKRHETDTASPEVQVALMTEKINLLTDHFKTHVKDHHSRIGLMKLVGRRRKLLNYLHREQPAKYKSLIDELGLRK